jgi:hypothetical protein
VYYGANFHAVIGGVGGAPMEVFFMISRAQNSAPATGTGITFAGTIGINDDMGECFGMGHSANLLGLGL